MSHICACCPQSPEEGVRAPGIQVTDGCEAYGCWKLSLNPCGLDPCEQGKCSYL